MVDLSSFVQNASVPTSAATDFATASLPATLFPAQVPTVADYTPTPYNERLTSNVKSYLNKWASVQTAVDQGYVKKSTADAIRSYDADRVARGSNPLTRKQTALAILAAQNRTAQTEPPDRDHGIGGILSNFVSDVGDMALGVGKMIAAPFVDIYNTITSPLDTAKQIGSQWADASEAQKGGWTEKLAKVWGAAVNTVPGVRALPELKDLGAIPQGIAKIEDMRAAEERAGVSGAARTGDVFGEILKLPGLRFIPGAHTVGTFAEEGWGAGLDQIQDHPGFTAADVLPIAASAAKASKVGQAAIAEAEAAGVARAGSKALPAVLTKRINPETGALEANALGRLADETRVTSVGNLLDQMWGERARQTTLWARNKGELLRTMLFERNGGKVAPEVASMPGYREARQLLDLDLNDFKVTPERGLELADIARVGHMPTILELPANEQALIARWREVGGGLAEATMEAKAGLFRDAASGEVYNEAQWKRIQRSRQVFATREAKFHEAFAGDEGRLARWSEKYREAAADRTITRGPRAGTVIEYSQLMDDLRASIEAKDYTAAREQWSAMSKKHNFTPGQASIGKGDAASGMTSAEQWAGLGKQLRGLADAEKKMARRAAPARFAPAIRSEVRRVVMDRLPPEAIERANNTIITGSLRDLLVPDGAEIEAALGKGIDLTAPDMLKDWQRRQFDKIAKEVSENWQALKEAGHDPVYMPEIGRDQVAELRFPQIGGGHIDKLDTAKARNIIDWRPTNRDMNVGLTFQAMELLRRQFQDQYARELETAFGRSFDDVKSELLPKAERIAARTGKTTEEHLDQLIRRQYRAFDASRTMHQPMSIAGYEGSTLVPRVVQQTLERLNDPSTGFVASKLDPVTGLFRMSVVGLSVRNQINNALGNFMMTGLEDAGTFSPRNVARAARFMRATGNIDDLLRGIVGDDAEALAAARATPQVQAFLAELGSQASDLAEIQYATGRKFRSILDHISSDRAANAVERGMNAGERVGKPVRALADWNMKANAFVDDFNRTMLFTRGLEKALREGKAITPAMEEGLALSRKVALNWKMLTPLERSVLRPIIPFYSWMRHIMSYTSHFPMDHPYKTAILSNIVRTEIDDEQSGLPAALRSLFFVGSRSPLGTPTGATEQTGLNVSSFNPFSSAATTWGLLGFLTGDTAQAGASTGSLSPLVKWLMETVGFDPASGTADLYPDLVYDPRVGNLVVKGSGNPITNLATSIVPQAGVAMRLAGVDPEFEEMARTNPAAAKRALASGVGIPLLWKHAKVDEEYGKAEVARSRAEDTAFSQAMKSGQWDDARRFPGMEERIQQVAIMQSQNPKAAAIQAMFARDPKLLREKLLFASSN